MPTNPSLHAYTAMPALRSHTAMVVNELGLGIVSGQYAAAAILPGDAELISRFGVSRTVLREALKTLSGKGLVQAKARVGTRVRERSAWNLFDSDVLIWHAQIGFAPDFLRHLGEMRLALEPEAAALAAQRRTPEQLSSIMEWVAKMGGSGDVAKSFVAADLGFHLAVAEAAANPFFMSISTLIEVVLVAMLTVSSPVDDPSELVESVAQHRAIADAIALGDANAARAAMMVVVKIGVARTEPRRRG